MRIMGILGAALMLALVQPPVAADAAGPPAPDDLVQARLVAETAAVAPGTTLWVDLHLDMAPGWHTYWRNPGDSGLATTIDWTVPAGFSAGAIDWPVPEPFVEGGIGTYGYAGTADLLVPIAVPKTLAAGAPVELTAQAAWLTCKDICIPGGKRLTLSLPVASGPPGPDPQTAALFAAARRREAGPARFETRFVTASGSYHLLVPTAALAGLDRPTARFFPVDGNLIDHAAPETASLDADGLTLVLKRAAGPAGTAPRRAATLDGVLVLQGDGGTLRAVSISANPAAAAPARSEGDRIAWWQALALAVLGGLLLNLMPCVFPILSLKVLGLAAHVHDGRAAQRRHGLAYGAGVIASFVALGGLLLALRAGGAAIGWGFQLQSPVVVGLIAYLLFAMGLGLSGVVEIGSGIAGFGGRLADAPGLAGAFGTGVLATVVAAPCTAPFMGTALGFALLAPPALALGVFVALGVGLAAPLVAASCVPGLDRLLPRPGAWMVVFRQLLAFPLYGTVAWLIWVLSQEVGPEGSLAALFGLVLVAFAAWVYGRSRGAAPFGRRVGTGLAAIGIAGAVALAATVTPAGADAAAPAGTARAGLSYEPFSPERLATLAAAHQPVFVNLTASWCITCLVNERAALDRTAVRRAFAARGIVALKGDWTRQNPAITRFLQQFGRSGVPLYLFYDGSDAPVILPQLLTESAVLDAIGRS